MRDIRIITPKLNDEINQENEEKSHTPMEINTKRRSRSHERMELCESEIRQKESTKRRKLETYSIITHDIEERIEQLNETGVDMNRSLMMHDASPTPKQIWFFDKDLIDNFQYGIEIENGLHKKQKLVVNKLLATDRGTYYLQRLRPILLDSLNIFHTWYTEHYGTEPCTLHNIESCFAYLDEFYAHNSNISNDMLQDYFIVAFILACKFDEMPSSLTPTYSRMKTYYARETTIDEYAFMEATMLSTLNYKLRVISTIEFIDEFLALAKAISRQEVGTDKKERWSSKSKSTIYYLATIKQIHYTIFAAVPSSHIAAAAIIADALVSTRQHLQQPLPEYPVEHWLQFFTLNLGWNDMEVTPLMELVNKLINFSQI